MPIKKQEVHRSKCLCELLVTSFSGRPLLAVRVTTGGPGASLGPTTQVQGCQFGWYPNEPPPPAQTSAAPPQQRHRRRTRCFDFFLNAMLELLRAVTHAMARQTFEVEEVLR